MSMYLGGLEPTFTGVPAGFLSPILQQVEIGTPLIALGLMLLYYYGFNGWGVRTWDRPAHWALFLLLSGGAAAAWAGWATRDAVVKPIVTSITEEPEFFKQPAEQARLDTFQLQLILVVFGLGLLLFLVFSLIGKGGSKHAWHTPTKWPRK